MPKTTKKTKRSVYLGSLYRFGYDLVCVGATKKEVVDAIMKNYDEVSQSENGCDPRKQFSYSPNSSDYDTVKEVVNGFSFFIPAFSLCFSYNITIESGLSACLKRGIDNMEKVTISKASRKYGFVLGATYSVLRNIMDECVVIMDENTPNAILSSKQLARYGFLEGTPELGGV